ncbi:MAG: SAM-dependent methyltransferase [Phycisphaerales bacterium]|nr:SAM-dependent methyltransferase [Phycisphaerales bacterium]
MKHDKASRTARLVSNGVYRVSQDRRLGADVPEELARYTEEMTRRIEIDGSRLGAGLARRWVLLKAGVMQACSIPGLYLHQVLRKRYIESIVRTAMDEGITQVVVIGAGFDTLTLRLSSHLPDCRFIEIDHPATQKEKIPAVDAFSLPIGDCHFMSADLASETLASALSRCEAYDQERATIFIAEGLTMYLSEQNIRTLLATVADQADGSSLVFTYMDETSPGRFVFKNQRIVTSWWLALSGERFTWGIREADLSEFLEESGFQLREHRTPAKLCAELMSEANCQATVALGEHTAWATQ